MKMLKINWKSKRNLLALSLVALAAGIVTENVYANWTATHTFAFSSTKQPIPNLTASFAFSLNAPTNTLVSCCAFSAISTTAGLQGGYVMTGGQNVTINAVFIVTTPTTCNSGSQPSPSTTAISIPQGAPSALANQVTSPGTWNYCIFYSTTGSGIGSGTLTVTYTATTP